MNLVLKINDVEDENLQEKLEEIAKRIDDYSSGILDNGVVWELYEDREPDEFKHLNDMNKKILETKLELIKEIETMENHERETGVDMTNDISYNRGYIGAIDYINDMVERILEEGGYYE